MPRPDTVRRKARAMPSTKKATWKGFRIGLDRVQFRRKTFEAASCLGVGRQWTPATVSVSHPGTHCIGPIVKNRVNFQGILLQWERLATCCGISVGAGKETFLVPATINLAEGRYFIRLKLPKNTLLKIHFQKIHFMKYTLKFSFST